MPIPSWPAGLPYDSLQRSAEIATLGDEQLNSEMEAGNTRSRPISTLMRSTTPLAIRMTNAEWGVFINFFNTTLGKGTSAFTMPIWTFRGALGSYGYVTRTVKIIKQQVKASPLGIGYVSVEFSVKVDSL